MTKKPEEPNWNKVIDEILEEMADGDDKTPVGLEGRGSFSQHTINLSYLENFDWSDDWIKARPTLLMWLEHEFEHWWEGQAYDDDGFQDWLNGNKHVVHGNAYTDDLTKRLLPLYRERIVQWHPCSVCNKATSEKHPWGHPDKLIKQGYLDPDIYPDGIPMDPDFDRDSLEWKWKIICDECWEKAHGRRRKRRRL